MYLLLLILIPFACDVLYGDDSCAPATALPTLVRSIDGGFLSASEWVVFDVYTSMPSRLRGESRFSSATYQKAHAEEPHAGDLNFEYLDAEFIRIGEGRWLLAKSHTSLVRRGSIDVIDDRQGAGLLFPPTMAPTLGGNAGAVLAQPHASGVTLCVGSARIFCGVRSAARSLTVTAGDIEALASLAHVPTPAELLVLARSP